jgi:dethiobiotin synthase
MSGSVFITGTDTGVGKTFFAALLLRALRARGRDAGYWKPLQTGPDSDTRTVARLAEVPEARLAEPCFISEHAMAPARAAALESRRIEPAELRRAWVQARPRAPTWVVEGAGGLLVPLTGSFFVRDLIVLLELPMILVASSRLGTINHTCLTVQSARAAGLEIRGIAITGKDDAGLPALLAELTGIAPVVAVPWDTTPDDARLEPFLC